MESQSRATVSSEKRGQKLLTFGLFCVALSLIMLVGKLGFKARQPVGIELERAILMSRELGKDMGEKPVIAFVTEWCPACRAAERYFSEEGIAYIRADIEESEPARRHFEELSGQTGMGIPQIVVGTQVLVGFDRGMFEKAHRELMGQSPTGVLQ